MEAYNAHDSKVTFYDLIKNDKQITSVLSDEEIEDIFDLNYHLKNVDHIFERVLG